MEGSYIIRGAIAEGGRVESCCTRDSWALNATTPPQTAVARRLHRVTRVVAQRGWVDLDLGIFPNRWAATSQPNYTMVTLYSSSWLVAVVLPVQGLLELHVQNAPSSQLATSDASYPIQSAVVS